MSARSISSLIPGADVQQIFSWQLHQAQYEAAVLGQAEINDWEYAAVRAPGIKSVSSAFRRRGMASRGPGTVSWRSVIVSDLPLRSNRFFVGVEASPADETRNQ
jgi:hypothetical protein